MNVATDDGATCSGLWSFSLEQESNDSSSARATVALAAVATHRRSAARRDRQRGWAVEALTIVLRGTTGARDELGRERCRRRRGVGGGGAERACACARGGRMCGGRARCACAPCGWREPDARGNARGKRAAGSAWPLLRSACRRKGCVGGARAAAKNRSPANACFGRVRADARRLQAPVSRQPRSEERAATLSRVAQLVPRARAGAPAARLRDELLP
jgi:hypothetical protein